MNRAKRHHVVLHTLLAVLMLAMLCGGAVAQSRVSSTNAGRTAAARAAVAHRATTRATHTFYPQDMKALPTNITRRTFSTAQIKKAALWTAPSKVHRAPGDQTVIRQTVLLTSNDPTIEYNETPAVALNEHPFWTADQQYIYFDSNRDITTAPGTNPVGGAAPLTARPFNIFRMLPDGTGVVQPTQLVSSTVNGTNQLDPNVTPDGGRLAFVAGGTITFPAVNAVPVTSGFTLYTLDLNGGTLTQLTGVTPTFTFTDVRHPTWAPGGNAIAFAGLRQGAATYHIFTIDTATSNIVQLTDGPSNDYSPAWSPDGNLIAFTTNAAGFSNTPAPAISTGKVGNDDIYVINFNPALPLAASRVTNFAAGGNQSWNRNPAWSSTKLDPLGEIPKETTLNGSALQQSEEMIAFATNRQDTKGDGSVITVPASGGGTADIYWLHARVSVISPGTYTVNTPESAGNIAHHLQTSQPDTAIDPTDPSYNFDPNFVSNEDFPAWPQYQSTYRIVYQSDKGSNLEIYGSTILDIDAPTLLKYDIAANEIVHVALNSTPNTGARQFNAGDLLRFRVRAVDYQSGVESMYLQIKVPDSSPKSADGVEHKVFTAYDPPMDSSPDSIINAPYEIDSQAIDAYSTNTSSAVHFKANGVNSTTLFPLLPNWPGANLYTPGVEDIPAFSGEANPPDEPAYVSFRAPAGTPPVPPKDGQGGFWLRLYDDGPVSQGGHEPEGETAGDGVYTAVWQTPPSFPSDFIIDVIARDMAINPFDTGQAINWKMYDNVWGFSTKPFQATSGILYVSDYDTGQKFLGGRFGTFGTQGTNYFFNILGLPFNGTPTESWMTEFDPGLFPTSYVTKAGVVYPLTHFETSLGANSYVDAYDSDGTAIPPTQRYDIWRIQCRGPIPTAILNQYAPTPVQYVPYPSAGGGAVTPPAGVIAEKCVIWHSPYTGDLFVGPGTILDPAVQAQLTNFVGQGGRLMVQGQDVAWGLTLGGSSPNAFLNNVLQCTYVADDVFLQGGGAANDQLKMTAADPAGQSRGGIPIAWETWYPPFPPTVGHLDFETLLPVTPDYPPASSTLYIGSNPFYPSAPLPAATKEWECPNQGDGVGTPDQIAFTPAPTTRVDNIDAAFSGTNSPAIVWFTNTSTHSKVVFSPFGWEAIHCEWVIYMNTGYLYNHRTELLHNALDYLRTGRLVGVVRSINATGGTAGPVGNAVVRAYDPVTKAIVGTAKTLADGSYIIAGLDPVGFYAVDGVKAGYVTGITQHLVGNQFHGAYQSELDFNMTQAQPGNVTGTITDAVTGQPVAGVIVTAKDDSDPTNPNPPIYQSTASDSTGKYSFAALPNSSYTLYITAANLAAVGYASSVPPTRPGVLVGAAQIVTGQDFALKKLPGSISGKVDIADANGNDTGTPLAGASVTATSTTNSAVTFSTTQVTGANGLYSIAAVDAGTYNLVASAPGYQSNTATPVKVTVTSTVNTVAQTIALQQIPPGIVRGLVTTSTGSTVGGATIVVTDSAGHVVPGGPFLSSSTVSTGTDAAGNSYSYNFQVPNVPAGGNVTITATEAGYNAKSTQPVTANIPQSATVYKDVNGNNIVFLLDPLFSYSASQSLVSAPYQWTLNGAIEDVVTLLNVPSADVADKAFSFITWDSTAQAYVYHPTPPADGFHLGVGYFMEDSALGANGTLPLTNATGTLAPQDASGNYLPFNITLNTGWNLIGMPFTSPVDLAQLQINDGGTLVDVPSAQSGGNPALGAALWTYENGAYEVVYTLDPYRGYWLRAYRPVTLIITPNATQNRGLTATSTRALEFTNNQSSNWKLQVVAQAGKRVAGNSYLGTNRSATDSYDRYKMLAPPSVSSQDVAVTFEHTDWASKSGSYSVDVRSPAATTWNFTVRSTVPNTPVTLTWPNLATTGRHNMTLTDLDTNTSFELHNRASYVLAASNSEITRHFSLTISRATRPTLQVTNIATALSLPTKGIGRASANIQYNLTADATVEVRILQGGRTVRVLEPGNNRAAGVNQVVWDLTNDHGVPVPSNVYTVEVRAIDSNGHVAHRPSTLVITR